MSNTNKDRKQESLEVRVSAAQLAAGRVHPAHVSNNDETKFRNSKGEPTYLASFTKGMPHNETTGLVDIEKVDYQLFVRGIDSGDPRDFVDVPLGPDGEAEKPVWKSDKAQNTKCGDPAGVRAWESQGAGNTFDLQGPDAQAVTMPPAPELGSDELIAEIGEVYAQALLRDVPFTAIVEGTGNVELQGPTKTSSVPIKDIIDALNNMKWFKDPSTAGLTAAEASRKRGPFTSKNAFRGITKGDDVGPYISQFLLAGNRGLGDVQRRQKGMIAYGSISIDQRVRNAKKGEDHMTTWNEYLDVQNGANLGGEENYESDTPYRFITTPRDLATYVHYDALYEAYLNACLILLGAKAKFDPGLPFQADDHVDHQQAFAHFGGPHILSLVTEVATRALKAVRFQKFNVHRRLRPEALAARFAKHTEPTVGVKEITEMMKDAGLKKILELVTQKNEKDQFSKGNFLLPMAFCEGSPVHPAYGAGHATVAGACVTILKAFFDHNQHLILADERGEDEDPKAYKERIKDPQLAFVPDFTDEGESILKTTHVSEGPLTVEGELNKLCSNISIGRNWAGVHYFTDYIESIRMGEQIAIGILEEQKLTYGENFSMTVPLFDGGSIRI